MVQDLFKIKGPDRNISTVKFMVIKTFTIMNVLVVGDVLNGHNGTFKITSNIAHGLNKNNKVKLVFFGRTNDFKNVLSLIDDIDFEIIEPNRILGIIERLIKNILIKKHSNFQSDDIPSIFSQLLLYRHLHKIKFHPDMIIFSNVFSSFSLLRKSKYNKNIIILHEAPLFDDFNFLFRTILRKYLNILNRKALLISSNEQTTSKIKFHFNYNVVTYPPISFTNYYIKFKKEKNVLLDTRWTANRDPMFITKIAPLVDNVKIIMHGIFVDKSIESELMKTVAKNNYNIDIVYNDDNDNLIRLYKRALIVLRWNALNETGNSVAFMDAVSYDCIPIVDGALGISKFISENISSDLVVSKNEQEIAHIINKLIEDENYYNTILFKVRECKERFSWEAYSENLIRKCW